MTTDADNRRYAKQLTDSAMQLVDSAMKVAVEKAHFDAMAYTIQDSGNAAYNWNVSLNGTQRKSYDAVQGQGPVGRTGDKRSASGAEVLLVINHNIGITKGLLGSATVVDTASIYNPMPQQWRHADNAVLEAATVTTSVAGF